MPRKMRQGKKLLLYLEALYVIYTKVFGLLSLRLFVISAVIWSTVRM